MANLPRLARTVTSLELLAVLLMAPALVFPTPTRLLVLCAVPVLWLAARVSTGRGLPATPFNVLLWVMLAMVGVSAYATFDILLSLGKMAGLVFGILVFWAVARVLTTPSRLKTATQAFIGAGAVLAVAGLIGTNWAVKFPGIATVLVHLPIAIRGLPGAPYGFQPNAVAGCLVLFVPLQCALLAARLRTRPSDRQSSGLQNTGTVLQGVLLALTMTVLLLSQSRGAWAGMVVAGWCWLAWRGGRTRAVAVAVLVFALVGGVAVGPGRLVDAAVSRSGPGMAGNIAGRIELWSRGVYGIRDFPMTGMGMNTFRRVMPVMYPAPSVSPDVDVAHAHQHLLQVGLDLGIPGLVAYLGIWLLAPVLLIQVHRRAQTRTPRVLAGGIGCGLIAHFVFSMTDAIPLGSKVGVLFWLALALATGLHQVAGRPTRQSA